VVSRNTTIARFSRRSLHDALPISATDVAGNVSVASGALSVTIDTTAPVAPTTPDLIAASDSGASITDNITNATTPTFAGTAAASTLGALSDLTTQTSSATPAVIVNWNIALSTL